MNIVEPLLPPVIGEQPDESSKRKRDVNVGNDKDIEAIKLEDVKPSRKALLAAKLAELEERDSQLGLRVVAADDNRDDLRWWNRSQGPRRRQR